MYYLQTDKRVGAHIASVVHESLVTVKFSAQSCTMKVLPVWELAIPLPAVMLIIASLYMILLGIGLWIRHCLKDHCSSDCTDCCPRVSVCEQCYSLAETCDCRLPTISSLLPNSCCSPSCANMDCSCTCQPPECEDFNCFCLEIRIK